MEMQNAKSDSEISQAPLALELAQAKLAEIQAARPEYSVRAFAKKIGLSPGQYSDLVRGKRPLTPKIARRMLERLFVDPETIENAVRGLKTKRPPAGDLRLRYIELTLSEFRAVSDWYYFAILSLAETEGFRSDEAWIANRLGIKLREASSAISALLELGLLRRNQEGALVVSGKQFTTTHDIPSSSIQKNHAQGLELAQRALMDLPPSEREFGAAVIALDPDSLPEIKRKLREMRREISEIARQGKRLEVYRLGFQLFPLSKSVSYSQKTKGEVK